MGKISTCPYTCILWNSLYEDIRKLPHFFHSASYVNRMAEGLDAVVRQLKQNWLSLNSSKTEVLWLGRDYTDLGMPHPNSWWHAFSICIDCLLFWVCYILPHKSSLPPCFTLRWIYLYLLLNQNSSALLTPNSVLANWIEDSPLEDLWQDSYLFSSAYSFFT